MKALRRSNATSSGAVLVLVAALRCAACSEPPPQAVKIAVSIPGEFSFSESALLGIRLAVEERTARGARPPVELLPLERGNLDPSLISVEQESRAARRAAADPAVVAYLGPMFSETAKASIPILNRAGIVQLSVGATWPGLTVPGFAPGEPGTYYPTGERTFFRLVPNDERQALAAARWSHELGFQTFYILAGGSAYGRGMAGMFHERILDFGADVLGHETLKAEGWTDADLEALVARVVTAEPEMLYFTGDFTASREGSSFTALGRLRRRLPEMGVMVPETLANSALTDRIGPDVAEGMLGVSGAVAPQRLETAAIRRFIEAFERRYGKPPASLAASSYEATNVLLTAIDRAAMRGAATPSRKAVLGEVASLGLYDGLLGRWWFSPEGDIAEIGTGGLRVEGGRWTYMRLLR